MEVLFLSYRKCTPTENGHGGKKNVFHVTKFIETMIMTFKLQYTNCIIVSDQFCTFINGVQIL